MRLFAVQALCAAVFVLVGVSVASPAMAQDALLREARQLIDAGQARTAFDRLAPLESERAGDPAFDFLLGQAANEIGQHTRAVFALERVLALQPGNAQARAELARAYFEIGENRAARQEFEAVKASGAPSHVAAVAERFLNALDIRQSGYRTGVGGYLELSLGHDSNVNTATGAGTLAIPLFGGNVLTLDRGTSANRGVFYSLGGGVSGRYVFSPSWSAFVNAGLSRRVNPGLDRFDTGSYGGDAGATYRSGASEYNLALQAQAFDLDERRYRNALGALFQWRYTLDASQQVTAYLQTTRLTYPAGYTISRPLTQPTYLATRNDQGNAIRTVIGAAWARSLAAEMEPAIYAGVYGGEEKLMTATGPEDVGGYNLWRGHRVLGMRAGGEIKPAQRWSTFLNLAFEDRTYGGADPLFLDTRHDRQFDLRFGVNYALSANLTLTPQLQWTENRSNISLYGYRRDLLSLALRYDFR